MAIAVELEIIDDSFWIPDLAQFEDWVSASLGSEVKSAEVSLRIVGVEEMRSLNKQYRNKDSSTNILSFPVDIVNKSVELNFLGDLVICASVIDSEAKIYNKSLVSRWAHIVVHGCLHLLGYDHVEPLEAEKMEGLESKILKKLGFSDPYFFN